MTSNFALEYIRRRTEQLGIGDDYYLKWRHLFLSPLEVRKINAGDDLYILVNELPNISVDEMHVRVVSEFGIYDPTDKYTNEFFYEHRGKITVASTDEFDYVHVQFIQVIPKNKPNGNLTS